MLRFVFTYMILSALGSTNINWSYKTILTIFYLYVYMYWIFYKPRIFKKLTTLKKSTINFFNNINKYKHRLDEKIEKYFNLKENDNFIDEHSEDDNSQYSEDENEYCSENSESNEESCNDDDEYEDILKTPINNYTQSDKPTYPVIQQLTDTARSLVWPAHEIFLERDYFSFLKLDDATKNILLSVLSFFVASEGLVNENLMANFISKFKYPEIKSFIAVQLYMEDVHGLVYFNMLKTFVINESKRADLLLKFKTFEPLKTKFNLLNNWLKSKSIAKQIVASSIFEGIFFSGAFAVIFNIVQLGKFPGLLRANQFIMRDETMHCKFYVNLYKNVKNKLDPEDIKKMIISAVDVEINYWRSVFELDEPSIGFDCDDIIHYTKMCANTLARSLIDENIYDTELDFDDFGDFGFTTLMNKDNFLINPATNYSSTVY